MTAVQRRDMTPEEIAAFLESGAVYRPLPDILAEMYSGDHLRDFLKDRLCQISGDKPENVERNRYNWFNGQEIPQRKQLFKICFALELDETQADQVIASASDTGIHYRNPEELIYAYCLRTKKSYKKALRLQKELLPKVRNLAEKEAQAQSEADGRVLCYSRQLQREFGEQVGNDGQLKEFLFSHAGQLGKLHQTARKDFLDMLGKMQRPEDETLEKGTGTLYSLECVADRFLQMHVPKNIRRGNQQEKDNPRPSRNFTYLQQVIQKNWPSKNILSNMKTGRTDVSRKVMLLLFLCTEEFEVRGPAGSQADSPLEDIYLEIISNEDENVRMMARLQRINCFLDTYGMNRLDVGNPFDCLVLYALKAAYSGEDSNSSMRGRLEQTLQILFKDHEI